MQALQFPFTRNDFHHELLMREGLVCLVKRSKPSHSHFEIVKLRSHQKGLFSGESILNVNFTHPMKIGVKVGSQCRPNSRTWPTKPLSYYARCVLMS
jgi:hypothetical protein